MAFSKILMVLGAGLLALGLVLSLVPNLFGWFGKLPGDIRIEKENSYLFFPVTSMIVISVVLSILFSLFAKK